MKDINSNTLITHNLNYGIQFSYGHFFSILLACLSIDVHLAIIATLAIVWGVMVMASHCSNNVI